MLGWYTLYTWTELLSLYLPLHAQGFDFGRVHPEVAITLLSAPLFASALAAGLAQLLAVSTSAAGDS